MADEAPTTLTGYRLTEAEKDISEIRGHVSTITTSVAEIAQSMVLMRDSMERSSREATEYRRETRKDIKCIHDKWQEYQPILDEVKTTAAENKALRRHLKYTVAGGGLLGFGGAVWAGIKHWAGWQ